MMNRIADRARIRPGAATILLGAAMASGAGAAAGQELRGSAFLETRLFPASAAHAGQSDASVSPSFGVEPELIWENAAGVLQLRVKPFLRIDAHDDGRTHLDIREASALYLADGWTLYWGIGKVFWGRTEANHLVDIINQTDGVEGIDSEDKLGQPMVNFTLERTWGALDLFYMPYFRERTFPGREGRLRGWLPILQRAEYESGARRWHPDLAARWSHFLGELDIGVAAFRGTSRDPVLVPIAGTAGPGLQARYDIINQLSVDAQWTAGPTLWKLEALARLGHGSGFVAATIGIEHTFFGLGSGPADLGVLAELMVDGRGREAPFTAFDNDVFLGFRWALNDTADTSILGGPVIDYRTGEIIVFLEAERRFGDRWVATLEARGLFNPVRAGPLAGLRRDNHLAFVVSRYF